MMESKSKPVVVIDGEEYTLHRISRLEEDAWCEILGYHEEGSISDEELARVEHFFDHDTGYVKAEYLNPEK